MIYQGNNMEVLRGLDCDSIDSVCTDPPYGLKFMSKKWDYDVPAKELWIEVLRVLKPGGHLLSFGGTRTYHRMVVNIEDAGFEIRDQIQWLYGSGFPKSHNIGKKIKEYNGWGTALKPANEPICLARKPLSEKTIVDNVLKWGAGGINIDGCRIEANDQDVLDAAVKRMTGNSKNKGAFQRSESIKPVSAQGRFPANIILDEAAAEMLGEPARFFYQAKASKAERNAGLEGMAVQSIRQDDRRPNSHDIFNTEGCNRNTDNKPQQNHHPTVKPIRLMAYLTKLITPVNGTVLDPFMGSGTTGIACKQNGFDFIGIELDKEYYNIAQKRLA